MKHLDLQQRIKALEEEVESWEKALMDVIGHYGVRSDPLAIIELKNERDALQKQVTELSEELERLNAQPHSAYIIQDKKDRDGGLVGHLSFRSHNAYSEEDVNEYEISSTPLYAEPRPAAAVPFKVPEEMLESQAVYQNCKGGLSTAFMEGFNQCRSEFLRLNAGAEVKS